VAPARAWEVYTVNADVGVLDKAEDSVCCTPADGRAEEVTVTSSADGSCC
jgi:hypothetical protein